MQLLIIKLSSPEDAPLFACISNKQTEATFVQGTWDDVRKQQRGRKVLLLIPDDEVLLAETHIPSKNKKQMLQALPYALEETLAEDIEDLHFSAYRAAESDPVHAAIINHDRLGVWVDALKAHDITVNYVLPSVFALSVPSDGWSVLIGEQEAKIRQSLFKGFACDVDTLDFLLPPQLEQNPPDALYVSGDSLRLTRLLHDQNIEIRAGNAAGLLQYSDIAPTLELNLLNNYSRGESALTGVNWSPWKPVAVIAGLLLLTWVGMFTWQNHQLTQQLESIEDQIGSVYRSTISGGRLTDADAQLSSMTSTLSLLEGGSEVSGASPLPTIAKVAPLFKQFQEMTIKELGFRRNKLEINVEAPNLSMLENFKNAASKNQLTVNIGSSKTTASNVTSTLTVQEAL